MFNDMASPSSVSFVSQGLRWLLIKYFQLHYFTPILIPFLAALSERKVFNRRVVI